MSGKTRYGKPFLETHASGVHCSQCNYKVEGNHGIRLHYKYSHGSSLKGKHTKHIFTCEICSENFENGRDMIKHLRSHGANSYK